MRLLQYNGDNDFSLTEFFESDIPKYAILSHRWELGEVTFKDVTGGTSKGNAGYSKIQFCGEQARRDGLQYFWVDTCCIDKSNAVELQEAINSMFRWYQNATKCYVYLSDVLQPRATSADRTTNQESTFRKSAWFTRSWTLQELLAPRSVDFFSKEGELLGNKASLEQHICEVTGIPAKALQGRPLSDFSLAERFSWAARRETFRQEDKAYSMFGIFGVFLPLIYGEGKENALKRLRQEIDNSNRLGYSTATGTAQDLTSLTQRTSHRNAIVNLMDIAEPSGEDRIREESVLSVRHCSVCNILLFLWIFLALLSLTVGLWRSFKTSDEGKGFTDAAYVVAVGGLIIFPIQNRHASSCKRK